MERNGTTISSGCGCSGVAPLVTCHPAWTNAGHVLKSRQRRRLHDMAEDGLRTGEDKPQQTSLFRLTGSLLALPSRAST